ncbi:haloacid dehalogenase type II [Pedobacter sp.]|uniref:haloacid dehalogenase type II n=1 Tax=Pedobacter sp. TaxID=1411316 RepID=UPI003C4318F7
MKSNRRIFMKKAGAIGLSGIAFPTENHQENMILTAATRPKVLFFDVNETLLDLANVKHSVAKALNGKQELLSLWFTTMLQYSLVATVGRHYEDFGSIGAATLRMVAANNGISISDNDARDAVIIPLQSLSSHPEVKNALASLRQNGYKLVSLTNSSNQGVEAQFKHAGLLEMFDGRLSTEFLGKFKPHSDVYDWAARSMGCKPGECLLVAAHGWDIAGALWSGWRAAFIQRPGAQLYPLAPEPEMSAPDLTIIANNLIKIS